MQRGKGMLDLDEKNIPKEVEEMVQYAYSKVPLYTSLARKHNLTDLDFFQLPYVSKDVYMESKELSVSVDYLPQMMKGQLFYGKTSGSTGKITEYYWDRKDENKSLMELWYYRRKYYNITPADKLCYFFPISSEATECIEDKHILGISKSFLYNGRIVDAYLHMLEYQPKWLILQPSVAWMLCQAINNKKLEYLPSVDYIEFTGEYLEDSIRQLVEEVFRCKTANQYGIREVNSIAYECPERCMHVMNKNAYIEVLADDGEVGNIVVTSLKNRVMPYIRYDTGDKGRWVDKKCKCGNHNPILEVCNGRDNDWIRKINGELLHPYALLEIINEINCKMNGAIIQYQLIQKELDYFQYRFVVREDADTESLEKELCLMTAERLQQEFNLEIRYYRQLIPDIKTGKIAAFCSEINKENED